MNKLKNTLYGKQRILIKKDNKIIYDYWIDAKLFEENEMVKLDFMEEVNINNNETLTLGEFKFND